MSLIQEALEKAGRLSVPQEKPLQEAAVEKISAAKAEPLWRVGLKVKFYSLTDKIRSAIQPGSRPHKAGFIAGGLILFFLGTVLYLQGASPKISTRTEAAGTAHPSSAAARADFELTGITLMGASHLALINNQVVGVGEKLKEGATVLEVKDRAAAIDFHGKRIDLEI